MVLEDQQFSIGRVRDRSFIRHISVILNITPDHLDRHKTIERYAQLKERIAANKTPDDVLVLNHDDPWVTPSHRGGQTSAKMVFQHEWTG